MSYARNHRRKIWRRLMRYGVCWECKTPLKKHDVTIKIGGVQIHPQCLMMDDRKTSLPFPTLEQTENW